MAAVGRAVLDLQEPARDAEPAVGDGSPATNVGSGLERPRDRLFAQTGSLLRGQCRIKTRALQQLVGGAVRFHVGRSRPKRLPTLFLWTSEAGSARGRGSMRERPEAKLLLARRPEARQPVRLDDQ